MINIFYTFLHKFLCIVVDDGNGHRIEKDMLILGRYRIFIVVMMREINISIYIIRYS